MRHLKICQSHFMFGACHSISQHLRATFNFDHFSGAPAAEGRQAEPHTHISGAPAAEGRQAEPHTHIRKLKGTHELIFSCVSWLAVLLVGAYARRRRRRRRRWWSRATWRPQLTRKPKRHVNPWFKASFGHPCCRQLTPVKTRNPLTSIT